MSHQNLDNPEPRNPEMVERDSIPSANPAPTVPGSNSAPGVNMTPREDIGDLEDREGFEIIETDEPNNRSR